MAKCVNEKCNRNPSTSPTAVIVSTDGDMACCPECKREYERQMDHFCTNILPDDKKFASWMGVPEEWVKKKGG
jgi:hypothetical protein